MPQFLWMLMEPFFPATNLQGLEHGKLAMSKVGLIIAVAINFGLITEKVFHTLVKHVGLSLYVVALALGKPSKLMAHSRTQ